MIKLFNRTYLEVSIDVHNETSFEYIVEKFYANIFTKPKNEYSKAT